jgi:predicted NUDIX family phosphoesterase
LVEINKLYTTHIQLLPLTAHVDTFELGQQINKLKIKKTFSWKYVKAEHISKIKGATIGWLKIKIMWSNMSSYGLLFQ